MAAMCAAAAALALDKCSCSTSSAAAAFTKSIPQASLRHSTPDAAAAAAATGGVVKFVRSIQFGNQIPPLALDGKASHSSASSSSSSSSTSSARRKSLLLRPRNSASDDSSSPSSSSSSTSSSSPQLEKPSASVEGMSPPELPGQNVETAGQKIRRQADSTDWVSSSLTRRFGLVGGLAWAGFLAFGVISEQVKTRTEAQFEAEATRDVEDPKEVTLDNNVKYVDLRSGGGATPLKGDVVLLDVVGKVRSTGQVFVDTTTSSGRTLAFVYGLKPYPRGVCYGLEYAIKSMRAGGKRKVTVPADQCFGETGEDFGKGIQVPGGEDVEFEVQLQRVSIAPS